MSPRKLLPAGTSEIKESNGSLYQLYGPNDPEVDIVFFHGLQPGDASEAWWKTWYNVNKEIWPQEFLKWDFSQARILSVKYNSSALRLPSKRFDIDEEGKKLMVNILETRLEKPRVSIDDCPKKQRVRIGNRPVILVGHSLGGLDIKSLILQAHHKRCLKGPSTAALARFLDTNLAGIFYYATPHGGSALADVGTNLTGTSSPTHFLKAFGKKAASLNHEFSVWRKAADVPVSTIAETQKSKVIGAVKAVVVKRSSASLDSDCVYTVDENHSTVCKPKTRDDETYFLLRRFIGEKVHGKTGLTLDGNWKVDSALPDALKMKEVKQINYSLYELCCPSDDLEFDIILFHGVLKKSPDALLDTWSNEGEPMWPRYILPQAFPRARVLAVRYGSSVLNAASIKRKLDIYFIGETLVNDILCHNTADIGNRPVILVGQGLGSLVIKEFILRAEYIRHQVQDPSRINKFLDGNIRGIFYFAKPPGGAIMLNMLQDAILYALSLLNLSSKDVTELNSTFHRWVQRHKILIRTLAKSTVLTEAFGGQYLFEAPRDISVVFTDIMEIFKSLINRQKPEGGYKFIHTQAAESERLEAFINECMSLDYIEKVKQINDSLFELYRPVDPPKFDVILFHKHLSSDSYDAFWRSWSKDEKTIWPKDMLRHDFPNARVLIVRYDSLAFKSANNEDRVDMSEILVQDILCDEDADVGDRPVILVGQGLGASVLKDFVLTAEQRKDPHCNFDKNLIGIFYLAQPLSGSLIASYAEDRYHALLGKVKKTGKKIVASFPKDGDQARNQESGQDVTQLNNRFKQWLERRNISIVTVATSALVTGVTGGGTYLVEAPKDIADFYQFTLVSKLLQGFMNRSQNLRQGAYEFIRYDQKESTEPKYQRLKSFIDKCFKQ